MTTPRCARWSHAAGRGLRPGAEPRRLARLVLARPRARTIARAWWCWTPRSRARAPAAALALAALACASRAFLCLWLGETNIRARRRRPVAAEATLYDDDQQMRPRRCSGSGLLRTIAATTWWRPRAIVDVRLLFAATAATRLCSTSRSGNWLLSRCGSAVSRAGRRAVGRRRRSSRRTNANVTWPRPAAERAAQPRLGAARARPRGRGRGVVRRVAGSRTRVRPGRGDRLCPRRARRRRGRARSARARRAARRRAAVVLPGRGKKKRQFEADRRDAGPSQLREELGPEALAAAMARGATRIAPSPLTAGPGAGRT